MQYYAPNGALLTYGRPQEEGGKSRPSPPWKISIFVLLFWRPFLLLFLHMGAFYCVFFIMGGAFFTMLGHIRIRFSPYGGPLSSCEECFPPCGGLNPIQPGMIWTVNYLGGGVYVTPPCVSR